MEGRGVGDQRHRAWPFLLSGLSRSRWLGSVCARVCGLGLSSESLAESFPSSVADEESAAPHCGDEGRGGTYFPPICTRPTAQTFYFFLKKKAIHGIKLTFLCFPLAPSSTAERRLKETFSLAGFTGARRLQRTRYCSQPARVCVCACLLRGLCVAGKGRCFAAKCWLG